MSQVSLSSVSAASKLLKFKAILDADKLDAYYVSAEDEHLNEYLPIHRQRVHWLTGFSGESAPAIVTPEEIAVFVDGRFHLQVEQEVDASVVKTYKLGIASVKSPTDYILSLAEKTLSFRLGFDPKTIPPQALHKLQKKLKLPNVSIEWVATSQNLVDLVRQQFNEMPSLGNHEVILIGKDYSGIDSTEKLKLVRQAMTEKNVDCLALTRLDDIAWLCNLRGRDIAYNPVFESYFITLLDKAILFARKEIIPDEVETSLKNSGIDLLPYENYFPMLRDLSKNQELKKVWLDENGITVASKKCFEQASIGVEDSLNPITHLKSIKNETEVRWMERANKQASCAIIEHLAWAHQQFCFEEMALSEITLRDDLEKRYRNKPDFFDLSFPSIPGLAENSAIIHYGSPSTNKIAQKGNWYLIDSGAHYKGGTTDTTRTTVFGLPSQMQRQKYTLVLKAHIACAKQIFPEGTNGIQLDAICRASLWQKGLNFNHGTGHGVGAFLNVHEGPNRISPAGNRTFLPGMVTSIEPGYYEQGWGGIRLENLYIVREAKHIAPFDGKNWFCFETLTLVPFEKKLLEIEMLTSDELYWLKAYGEMILEKLGADVNTDAKSWLEENCIF